MAIPDRVEVRTSVLILDVETTVTHAIFELVELVELAELAELADKCADLDMLRQRVQVTAQRLMDCDVESLCGAGYDRQGVERVNGGSAPPSARLSRWTVSRPRIGSGVRWPIRCAPNGPSWVPCSTAQSSSGCRS
jgi:hypothetical protein